MTEKSAQKISSEVVLDKFYQTEFFALMMQTSYKSGTDISNFDLIKQIIGNDTLINHVVDFIKGEIDLNTALSRFKNNLSIDMERYNTIERAAEKLFLTLANIVKTILKIKKDTSKKVENVLEAGEFTEPAIGNSIQLQKEKPTSIQNAYQLKLVIKRTNGEQEHVLNIIQNGEGLKVWCPTADITEGAKIYLIIEKGSEYCIGQCNTTVLKMEKARLAKAKSEVQKAEKEFNKHRSISVVSRETETAKEKLKEAKQEVEIINLRIKKLEEDPRMLWFDKEKSSDISQDHIILKYTQEGVLVVTDEGEKCTAVLSKIK